MPVGRNAAREIAVELGVHDDVAARAWTRAVHGVDWTRAVWEAEGRCARDGHYHPEGKICGVSLMETMLETDHDESCELIYDEEGCRG